MLLSILRTYPVTLFVSSMALLCWANPTVTEWLQTDFTAIAGGQWWRTWTGHLTHYDGNHLLWDLLMFAGLGAACERRHGVTFGPVMVAMMTVISAAIAKYCPQIEVYRGLSGLDTGLFVWFVADQFRDCRRDQQWLTAVIWLLPGVGLIGKLLYEAVTGQTLFVNSSDFTPLVQSHLAGALVGLLLSVGIDWTKGTPPSSPATEASSTMASLIPPPRIRDASSNQTAIDRTGRPFHAAWRFLRCR